MTLLADTLGTETTLRFAALLLGHMLADFIFQTRRMVDNKKKIDGLLLHGAIVLLVHAAMFTPFLGLTALIVIAGISISHILIDRIKIFIEQRTRPSPLWFTLDQALHIVILLIAADILATQPPLYDITHPELFITIAIALSGAVLLGTGAGALVRHLLDRFDIRDEDGAPAAGTIIGILERLLIYVFALAGQWAAAVLVVAVKSLARFESLKDRSFAEYYLVGTLTSVLIAALIGLAVKGLVL